MIEPAPSGFGELAELIKARQDRVARMVNFEVVDLYWELGRRIGGKIKSETWGRGTVNGLAEYLTAGHWACGAFQLRICGECANFTKFGSLPIQNSQHCCENCLGPATWISWVNARQPRSVSAVQDQG